MFRVGLVKKGRSGRGIGDDVLDQRRVLSGERELGIPDPERTVLDEDFLKFAGALALVLDFGAEADDVRCSWFPSVAGMPPEGRRAAGREGVNRLRKPRTS